MRTGIGLVVVVDEAHRGRPITTEAILAAREFLRLGFQVPNEDLDDMGEWHLATAEARLLVDQGEPRIDFSARISRPSVCSA